MKHYKEVRYGTDYIKTGSRHGGPQDVLDCQPGDILEYDKSAPSVERGE